MNTLVLDGRTLFTCICGNTHFRPDEYNYGLCPKCKRSYYFGYQELTDDLQSTIVITAVLIDHKPDPPK